MALVVASSIIGGIFGLIWIFLDNSDFGLGKFIRNLIFLLISAGCGLLLAVGSKKIGNIMEVDLKWWNIFIDIGLILLFSLTGNDCHTEEIIDNDGVHKITKCGLGAMSYGGVFIYTLFITFSLI